ncbi:hypothetical protein NPIL_210581 [Nephila pilipes]|uniref:Uncharacterized protein n=1 Tax=Nephila pilipes TaxID=299642 RepID=A0A8X6MWQ8_NEPPI|nr:hypothetical protein NPIL_619181 [Nephila pilipes]GFS75927.1 hypothetical protein NPIL_336261 [Nephila pilipes]GFS81638.1 hypothetical protein NPIL_278811 [Nephila pilipes]GFT17077.1 hypothetical protein NPIL_652531 [Nephila pilipes]GFT20567.1 hypothetical protein NPIL_645351 [Nephila pilipes]
MPHYLQRSFISKNADFSHFNGGGRFTNSKNPEHSTFRHFSRNSKSLFRRKNKYNIVLTDKVGPKRDVPNYIPKPVYSATGIEEQSNRIEILRDVDVEHMKQSCSLAKIVLDKVEKSINV